MKKNILKSAITLLLILSVCVTSFFTITGCTPEDILGTTKDLSENSQTESGDNNSVGGNTHTTDTTDNNNDNSIEIIKEKESLPADTIQSNEVAYVYASVALDLMSYGYDVFNAVAKTEDGKGEYGLAYCDYEEGYHFENDEKVYVSSGFLSFSPNNASAINADSTVFLSPVDEDAKEIEDDELGYVVDFVENGIPSGHFIANNKYVQYSVKDGDINIDTYENKPINYDLSMGSIYNYDTDEYAFIPYDEISSDPIEYVALTDKIDAQKLKASLYAIVNEQEQNGYQFESITIAYISLDAMNALRGVLSQTDSLNGYSFDYLNSIEYDNMSQYLCFNEDGSITLKDIPPMPKTEVKSILDWVIDGLVIAGLAAIAVVSITFLGPAGPVIAAACVGAGIEYFNQTVIQDKKISEVNWAKVGIMAISGAVRAAIPCAGTLGFIAVGAIGGITSAAMTAIDGGSLEDILISGMTGATISMIAHGLFASCFPAGTKVLTIDGLVPIESIVIDTLVASYNVYTNKVEYKPVLNTYQNESSNLVIISLSNGTEIVSTDNHLFFDKKSNDFIAACDLTNQSVLLDSNGDSLNVVEVNHYVGTEKVYNLNISENHNYYISENAVLVHNKCNTYKTATRAKDGIKVGETISKKQALDRLRNGKDVVASSKNAAKSLAKDAFGNAKPYWERHDYIKNAYNHFHDAIHHIYHIFY